MNRADAQPTDARAARRCGRRSTVPGQMTRRYRLVPGAQDMTRTMRRYLTRVTDGRKVVVRISYNRLAAGDGKLTGETADR